MKIINRIKNNKIYHYIIGDINGKNIMGFIQKNR